MEIFLFTTDRTEVHFFEIYAFDLPSLFLRVKLGFKESPSSREKWNLAPFAELSLSVAVIVWITWNKKLTVNVLKFELDPYSTWPQQDAQVYLILIFYLTAAEFNRWNGWIINSISLAGNILGTTLQSQVKAYKGSILSDILIWSEPGIEIITICIVSRWLPELQF